MKYRNKTFKIKLINYKDLRKAYLKSILFGYEIQFVFIIEYIFQSLIKIL